MSTVILPIRNIYFFNDENIINCPICNTLLEIKSRIGNEIKECYECRYDDHPFGMCRSNKGECTCETFQVINKYIICSECCKCTSCSKEILKKYMNNNICEDCFYKNRKLEEEKKKLEEKNKFYEKWKNSTASEKLLFYGTNKLKKLASKKNIKGRSKMNKDELIAFLNPLVNNSDFPIK